MLKYKVGFPVQIPAFQRCQTGSGKAILNTILCRDEDSGLNGRDGLQSHHIPSYTAVEKYLEDQGVELDSRHKRKLHNDLGAVLRYLGNHKITRTYQNGAKKQKPPMQKIF